MYLGYHIGILANGKSFGIIRKKSIQKGVIEKFCDDLFGCDINYNYVNSFYSHFVFSFVDY